MICGACSAPAAVEVSPVLHLCERCENILKSKFTNLDFLSPKPHGENAAASFPPVPSGEVAAKLSLSPVSLNATPGGNGGACSDIPPPIVGAASNSEDGIPAFLRRDAANIPAYARQS